MRWPSLNSRHLISHKRIFPSQLSKIISITTHWTSGPDDSYSCENSSRSPSMVFVSTWALIPFFRTQAPWRWLRFVVFAWFYNTGALPLSGSLLLACVLILSFTSSNLEPPKLVREGLKKGEVWSFAILPSNPSSRYGIFLRKFKARK